MLGRSGLLGVLVLGGALYYSGAGGWLWARIEKLEPACYQGLADIGPELSNPVCGALGKVVQALSQVGDEISQRVSGLGFDNMFGGSDNTLQALEQRARAGISGFSSPSESLAQLIGNGPQGASGRSVQQQFQTAVDSFTIGQHFLDSGASGTQALPWLQQGAAQPQGMGLMSQISLANLYGTGAGGIPADPASARRYLQQASQSLSVLMASGSPQSRQVLGALKTDPRALKQQIDSALKQ